MKKALLLLLNFHVDYILYVINKITHENPIIWFSWISWWMRSVSNPYAKLAELAALSSKK